MSGSRDRHVRIWKTSCIEINLHKNKLKNKIKKVKNIFLHSPYSTVCVLYWPIQLTMYWQSNPTYLTRLDFQPFCKPALLGRRMAHRTPRMDGDRANRYPDSSCFPHVHSIQGYYALWIYVRIYQANIIRLCKLVPWPCLTNKRTITKPRDDRRQWE